MTYIVKCTNVRGTQDWSLFGSLYRALEVAASEKRTKDVEIFLLYKQAMVPVVP